MIATHAERVEDCSLRELPEGEYEGLLGGYVAEATICGEAYRFHLDTGVRGINIPCVVKVDGGTVAVEVLKGVASE